MSRDDVDDDLDTELSPAAAAASSSSASSSSRSKNIFGSSSSSSSSSSAAKKGGDRRLEEEEEEEERDVEAEMDAEEIDHIAKGITVHSTLKGAMWVEKYRPRKLDQIAHQDEVVKTLRRTLENGNLPHLLLYGPPGTGKTSTILAVAYELFGHDLTKKRVLELNASNERGIDVIRQKVKAFAQVAVGSKDTVPGFPCPPFKIIILDEADSMTRDAQSALRRTMELYARTTRFCIICNYVSRIIDPITSRCAKFRYQPLSRESMIKRLSDIAASEKIQAEPQALEKLVAVSDGDMRKCITLMQSAAKLAGDQMLTSELVMEVAGFIPEHWVDRLFAACRSKRFDDVNSAATDCIAEGFPVSQLLLQLQHVVIESKDLEDVQKSLICIRISEADRKLADGADESLQLMDVLSYTSTTLASVNPLQPT